jgi:hypothetical protein
LLRSPNHGILKTNQKTMALDQFLQAFNTAMQLLDRAKKADATLATRTGDVLDAARMAVRALGQEAQDLHEQIARLDLRAPAAEATIFEVSSRLGRYLRVDYQSQVVFGARDQLIVLRSEFAKHASYHGIPTRRLEAMADANATLNIVIDALDSFIAEYLTLTQRGSGIGAGTLSQIDGWLNGGAWRGDPQAAQDCWRQAAVEFQRSQVYRQWHDLDVRLAKEKQRLVTMFT